MMILSGDPPRSRVLSIILIVIIAALAVTPLVFPGAKATNVATKICIFATLVASYDLLLGYTGSVSFAHTLFYGIGSHSIAIALYSIGPGWAAVATGIVIGLPLGLLRALPHGRLSLRGAAILRGRVSPAPGELHRRAGGRQRRHAERTGAALCRTGPLAEFRHHAGHSADGGDRLHGHDLRRQHRRCDLHPGTKLSAGADGRGLQCRGRCRAAIAAGTIASGPLAALARAAIYCQRLFLSDRRRGTVAKHRPQADVRLSAARHPSWEKPHPSCFHPSEHIVDPPRRLMDSRR